MQAGTTGKAFNFWLVDTIAPDQKTRNWYTGEETTVESKTSQRYFVDNLNGAAAGDTVNLYINSVGGSVKEALGIYSTLRRCPATVVAYIDGYAASAASVIAMAADKIIMPRNTCMMVHNAAGPAYGNATQLRKAADDLEVINLAAIQSYMNKAGDKLPADKLSELLNAETWLTAEDCMEYGLADEYADTDADLDEAIRQYRAAMEAAPQMQLEKAMPSFMPAAKAPETAPPPPAEPSPASPAEAAEGKKTSAIFMLLESMTKAKE